MVNSRQKETEENNKRVLLGRMTEERWEQVPGSGSGKIKGDIRVPGKHNLRYRVKFYKDSGFNSKIYTKDYHLYKWWSKLCRQSQEMKQEPLIFRENYGKFLQ